jgi:hypothetical protein
MEKHSDRSRSSEAKPLLEAGAAASTHMNEGEIYDWLGEPWKGILT